MANLIYQEAPYVEHEGSKCAICNEERTTKWDPVHENYFCERHYRRLDTDSEQDAPLDAHDNDEIVTNEQGGKQSKLEYSYELLEPSWLRDVAHVLYQGKQKYGARNWQSIPDYREHLGRAMYHIQQAMEDMDHSEMHFANATCRLMFADWCYKRSYAEFPGLDIIINRIREGSPLGWNPTIKTGINCQTCNHDTGLHVVVGTNWDTKEPIPSCTVCGCRATASTAASEDQDKP